MNTMLLSSYFALWALVLLLILAFAVLARQIGLLHRRLAPVGARMMNIGPDLGEVIATRVVTDIFGRQIDIGGPKSKPTLLVFLAATCSSCAELAPALRSLWKNERRQIDFVIIAVTGDEDGNRNFVREHGLDDIPYVVSGELGLAYKVVNPPYGVLLNKAGVVTAKGITNHLEHLESLLNAGELEEPSFDSYMRKRIADSSLEPALQQPE
jgi:methylamine dehydrogenase accessory protein MauD